MAKIMTVFGVGEFTTGFFRLGHAGALGSSARCLSPFFNSASEKPRATAGKVINSALEPIDLC